ncbi:MAG: hypothetical protein ACKOQ5_02700, partial [Solirubrobacterales bacterium]
DQSAPATRAADLLGSSGRIFRVRIAATDRVSGLSRVEFSTRAKKPSQGEQAGQTRAVSGEILNVRAAARPRWYRVSDRAGNWSAWKPVRPAR